MLTDAKKNLYSLMFAYENYLIIDWWISSLVLTYKIGL
jgi:hypothetical protein